MQPMQINKDQFVNNVNDKLISMDIDFEIEADWYEYAAFAMTYSSPLLLGVTAPEMKNLFNKAVAREKLNYYEFAVLSNNLEARTMKEMKEVPDINYFEVMEKAYKYTELWNIKGAAINNEVMREMVDANARGIGKMQAIKE